MKFIYTLLLSAILHPVVCQVNLERYNSEINKLDSAYQISNKAENAVLFTGSSSIRLWKSLQNDMKPIPVINHGFGGSTIKEVLHYADKIIFPVNTQLIILYCGENDLTNNEVDAKEVFKDFSALVKIIRKNKPQARLLYISIKPSPSRLHLLDKMAKANSMISKYCEKRNYLDFIDVWHIMMDENEQIKEDIFVDDRLHLNEKGYELWTSQIKPVVLKYWNE